MSGKKIHSNELKLQVVEQYLKGGVSIRDVANEFFVGASDVRKWKDAYLEHGVAGLCSTHGTYTGNFKISVVDRQHVKQQLILISHQHHQLPSGNVFTMSKVKKRYI